MNTREVNNISFFFEVPLTLKDRRKLKTWLSSLFSREGRKLESLNYIFCSDKRLLEINRQYLAHDFYTDIITFELSAKKNPVVAEIYISVDRVRENASTFGVFLSHEMKRVICHGALHLCGYRDKSPNEEKLMRRKENFYLDRFPT